ncbi:hypothetical protein ACM4WK_001688 [Campylobacter jejuni]
MICICSHSSCESLNLLVKVLMPYSFPNCYEKASILKKIEKAFSIAPVVRWGAGAVRVRSTEHGQSPPP